MTKNKLLVFFSLLLLVVFITPFMLVSKYVVLNLDDFCRATLEGGDYIVNIKEWYLYHNGRFINAIITLIPVYKITIYRWIIALQFIILGLAIYGFFASVFSSFLLKFNRTENFFITVVFYILIISTIPAVFEFFYWYASVTVYLFSFYFFLIFIQKCLKIYLTGELNFILLAIIIIGIVGNNELLLVIVNLFLMLLVFVIFFNQKIWNRSLILLNIIAIISSIAVVFSPGTVMRRGQFEYGRNFFGSIKVALYYSGEFLIESLLNFPLILFCLFIFFTTYKKVNTKNYNYIHPFWALGITYTCLFSVFFILFYATGLLDVYTGRIANFINCMVLVLIALNVVNLAVFIRVNWGNRFLIIKPIYSYFFILGFVVLIAITNSNYNDLRKDFLQDNFVRFDNDFKDRIQKIKNNKNAVLELKKIENTNILRAGDDALIKVEWVRNCYIRYLNNKNVNNIEQLYIK
jgi:hypothetical protein